MLMMSRNVIAPIMAALLVAACVGVGDLSPSGKLVEPATLAVAKSFANTAIATPAPDWWRAFGDPQLTSLIEVALKANPGLKVAEARLAGALAAASLATANRMPQVAVNFQGDRERFSENYIYPPGLGGERFTPARATLDFSYELDFWGRTRALLDAAVSETKAAEVDRDAARLLLAVAMARSYVELDRLYAQRDLVEKLLTERREALALAAARGKAGLDETSVAARSSAQLASVEGELPAIDQQIDITRHQLAALLGAGPDRGLAIERPKLTDAGVLALPAVLPADLLGRRPDVVAQRLRVEAADKYGEAARADAYPNVNLLAFVGAQSLGLNKLLESASSISGFGAAIHVPIYGGGRVRAEVRERYADYDAAVAQYNNTLTEALKEIANAVSTWRGVEARDLSQRTETEQIAIARDNARRRYDAGLTNKLPLIDRQFDLLTERRRGADIRAQRFAAAIELNRAVGGGFAPPAATSDAAVQPDRTNAERITPE